MHSKRTLEIFRQLVLRGVPYAEIVKDLRITRSTAFRWRKELSLFSRKTGPRGRK